MRYNFPMTLDRQFKNKLEELHDKFGTQMMTIEGLAPHQLDTCNFFKAFMETKTVADASIDDNANVGSKNINTMINESTKPFTKLLSKNKIYIEMKEEFGKEVADEYLEACVSGTLYEHDSHSSSFMPYCFAYSVKPIVEKGLFFIGEMKAKPPKHWDTFNHHILEFISYATNMQSGACGLPDYFVYAYYFFLQDTKNMNKDMAEKYRNQKFQEFIFNLNQPYLKGGIQSAYTNVSILDYAHIAKFFMEETYPDGSGIIEHMDGILQFQNDFMDYIGELRKEKWHTFPVISATLLYEDGKYVDEETFDNVVRHNWKFGFNDINIMTVPEVTSVASCCRMVNNTKDLNREKIFNSIGGSELNVGSTKVVTLNLVRMALLSDGNKDKFYDLVRQNVELLNKFHCCHRKILEKLIEKGLLPLFTHGLINMKDMFATTGINGVFEATDIFGGIDRSMGAKYTEEGIEFVQNMFKSIKEVNEQTEHKYGFISNVEQAPMESGAVKLNKKDRLFFGNEFINRHLGKDCYLYGNQWIPLKESTSVFNRIEASQLDDACGGGVILHINNGENFQTFEDAKEFTLGLARAGVKYFSYISLIDICKNDHSFFGDLCPICNTKSVSKGIKIVGYLVKQDSYKSERKRELGERQFYSNSER